VRHVRKRGKRGPERSSSADPPTVDDDCEEPECTARCVQRHWPFGGLQVDVGVFGPEGECCGIEGVDRQQVLCSRAALSYIPTCWPARSLSRHASMPAGAFPEP
jgi:hypothetical protein